MAQMPPIDPRRNYYQQQYEWERAQSDAPPPVQQQMLGQQSQRQDAGLQAYANAYDERARYEQQLQNQAGKNYYGQYVQGPQLANLKAEQAANGRLNSSFGGGDYNLLAEQLLQESDPFVTGFANRGMDRWYSQNDPSPIMKLLGSGAGQYPADMSMFYSMLGKDALPQAVSRRTMKGAGDWAKYVALGADTLMGLGRNGSLGKMGQFGKSAIAGGIRMLPQGAQPVANGIAGAIGGLGRGAAKLADYLL